MIADATELKVAESQLNIIKSALTALRHQLETANPGLLAITEKVYIRRIEDLQADISRYLSDPLA